MTATRPCESKDERGPLRAVLFKSRDRMSRFAEKLKAAGVSCTVLDFEGSDWLSFDYRGVDLVIFYPSFVYTSNHPHALLDVRDNLSFITEQHPHLICYPDPALIPYYNDKYRQFLFLSARRHPCPRTIPLLSLEAVEAAHLQLGNPMVLKNRYGAGGASVFRVTNKRQLLHYYRLSTLDLFNVRAALHFTRICFNRLFLYNLIKARRAQYPFLSPPLLAQEFLPIDRDLKTVVRNGEVVEAHWRIQATANMWKMNIDAGGIGEWSHVPPEALAVSRTLAQDLKARWLNIDLMESNGRFLISEFSPVWHHYAYKEKPSFVYKDDYNIKVPLKVSLDLEQIIVDSLIEPVQNRTMARDSLTS